MAARGLEPRHLAAPDPKSGVSANSTKRPACEPQFYTTRSFRRERWSHEISSVCVRKVGNFPLLPAWNGFWQSLRTCAGKDLAGRRACLAVQGGSGHASDAVIELIVVQEEEAAVIEDLLSAKARITSRYMARLMASQANRQFFGETEFLLRDAVARSSSGLSCR